MKNQSLTNNESNTNHDEIEITEKDIVSLLALHNIKLIDVEYALQHLTIKKKNINTSYEIELHDINGQKHQMIFEIKIYNT